MSTADSIRRGNVWATGAGDISLPSGNNYDVAIATESKNMSVINWEISTDSTDLLISLYEDASFSSGTFTPLINRNRVIGDSNPPLLILRDVSGAVVANKIIARSAVKTTFFQAANESSESGDEIIFETNSIYILRLTNRGGATASIDVSALLSEIEL